MHKALPFLALLLALVFVDVLKSLLIPTPVYPYAVVEVPTGIRLTILQWGKPSPSDCERAKHTLIDAVISTCPTCRLTDHRCLEQLNEQQHGWLGAAPLHATSARLPDGVVLYESASVDLALATCRESERQTLGQNDHARVRCHPAETSRPMPIEQQTHIERAQQRQGFYWITLLMLGLGMAGMLAMVARQSPGQAGAASGKPLPRVAKVTLATLDALVLIGLYALLAFPDSHDLQGWRQYPLHQDYIYLGLSLVTVGWFWSSLQHYSRRRPIGDELPEILHILGMMFLLDLALSFIAGLDTHWPTQALVWGSACLTLPITRTAGRSLLDLLGLWRLPAVIIGAGHNAVEAYKAIRDEAALGYEILGFVAPQEHDGPPPGQPERTLDGLPVFAAGPDIEQTLERLHNPQVIMALDSLNSLSSQALIRNLSIRHPSLHIIPTIRGLPLFGTELSHFFRHEVLFLTIRNNLSRRSYQWLKRSFDLAAASLLLLLLTPLFLLLAILIRRTGGTAFFGHTRIGRDGKPFKCLKFRSMRPDADKVLAELLARDPVARAEWEKDFKLKDDPRITPVGNFLRRTSLDELPQLLNVIRGEMSLVGPRPVIAEELKRYGESAVFYKQVRPGITGLWQISGRNDVSYTERVSMDAWYVRNWSLWYDIAILVKTVEVVLARRGAY